MILKATSKNDKYFQDVLADAAELAHELEIDAKFCLETRARPRKRQNNFCMNLRMSQ